MFRITNEQLKEILAYRKYSDAKIEELATSLNDVFLRYEIDTPLRVCHFLAQIIHESGGFKYNQEIWGPTKAQKRYDGRKDLGNVNEGDGYKYRGRGYIQLTGRFNYERAGRDLGMDFVNIPGLVATAPWNMIVAGWFWHLRNLIDYSDKDSIEDVTVRVNGGYNGIKDRRKWLEKSKQVLMPNIT